MSAAAEFGVSGALPEIPEGVAVTIAVPTRQRPALLAQLLRSIRAHAAFEPGSYLDEVLVVDNDHARSAEIVAAQARNELGLPVRYVVHERPGVAQARSRALAEAAPGGILVFVDDDEELDAASDWPAGLVRTMRETQADLVAGMVTRRLDGEADSAIVELLRVPTQHRHGEPMIAASAGNLAMKVDAVRDAGLDFDPRFDHVGGEDSAFTAAAVRAGLSLRWSAAGVLSEYTPVERRTESWLRVRARQGACTWLLIQGTTRPRPTQALLALGWAGAFALRGAVHGLVAVVTRREIERLRGRLDLARARGALDALRGSTVETYGRAHGTVPR